MKQDNTKEAIKETLLGFGAEKIEFLYPANMVHAAIVSYQRDKKQHCFAMQGMEFKLSSEPLLEMVKRRYEASLGSIYNSCQPMSIARNTQTPTKTE